MDELCERATGVRGLADLVEDPAFAVDRELQAAIEYKIAVSGIRGVERILEFVEVAVRRNTGARPHAG